MLVIETVLPPEAVMENVAKVLAVIAAASLAAVKPVAPHPLVMEAPVMPDPLVNPTIVTLTSLEVSACGLAPTPE
jgi:hypothetical protein